MVSKKELCVEKMKGVLHTLVAAGSQVGTSICDKVLQEFREFIDVASPAFANFEPKSDYLDVLLHKTIAPHSGWRSLWDVIHILFVMSHGQASVE